MRRIVTGLNASGQSAVVSIEEVEGMEVWHANTAQTPEWMAGQGRLLSFEPQAGWVKCLYVEMPPDSADDREEGGGEDGPVKGLHKTRSVDLVYFLDPVVLLLEEGETPIQAGDMLIQQGTMHDFRNPGGTPARLLGFSWGVPDTDPDN
ncbi:MAG TPA: hypothetical protein VGG41_16320 [Solirubrobacteraceae bacterium]|jgi:hypothetical protein